MGEILVTGFLERKDSRLEFHPMLWWIYVQFGARYLRCQSLDQWFLKLEITTAVDQHFEVTQSDFCVCSIGNAFLLNSHLEHRVKAFHCLLSPDCDPEEGRAKAGGIILEDGESIFFDPSSDHGLRIGSKDQVYKWTSLLQFPMRNYKQENWEVS
jgi:hypothetical protein